MSSLRFKELLFDDSAQATTEYVLILAIAIGLFLMVYAKLLKPMFKKLGDRIGGYFDNLLTKGNLHYFPIH